MADIFMRDLPYGHFGRAKYSQSEGKWLFERRSSDSASVHALTDAKLFGSSRAVGRSGGSSTGLGAHRSQRQRLQIKAVVEALPELQSVAQVLSESLPLSEAVEAVSSRYDPMKGKLIAFAKVYSKTSHRPLNIAALPSGESGTDLRLVQFTMQKRRFGDDKTVWLEVPTLQGKESIWTSNEGPIHQIVFAQAVNRADPLLAVRLSRMTVIFRPAHRTSPGEDNCGSSISPNLISTIDTKCNGSAVHVDVAFNPWFPQQIGIVDEDGHWTVLEYGTRSMDRLARSWSSRTLSTQSAKPPALQDAWSRITWIMNATTIAVCMRASCKLYSIENDKPILLQEFPLGNSGTRPWNLDFVLLHDRLDYCCLLTSSHLIFYKVSGNAAGSVRSEVKLCLRHYRDPEDITTRITTTTDDLGTYVVLRSGTSRLCTFYRFDFNSDGSLICHDPVEVSILPKTQRADSNIVDLHLAPVKLQQKATTNSESCAHGSSKGGSYFLATLLTQTFSALESLLVQPAGRNAYQEMGLMWESKPGLTESRLPAEGFVVNDNEADAEADERVRTHPVSRRARRPISTLPRARKSVDLSCLGRLLSRTSSTTQNINDILKVAESNYRSAGADVILPGRTLSSFVDAEIAVDDIDLVQDALQKLVAGNFTGTSQNAEDDADAMVKLRPSISRVATTNLPKTESLPATTSLHETYSSIVAEWIGTLREDVLGRVRLAKANIARQIATDITLASFMLSFEAQDDTQGGDEQSHVQKPMPLTWDLPVRRPGGPSMPSTPASQAFEQNLQQSALPTPSATPSIVTASSHLAAIAAPEIYRLSRYATFSKPAPSVLPRPLTKVLSHWESSADPEKYDWLSTSKHIIQREEAEEDQDLTERERRRLQRRAERYIQRQRKEVAASQAQQLASSQAPEITTASQPTPRRVESQPVGGGSQPFMSDLPAASQVVPGRFGGRPAKKKRKSGF